MIFSVKIRPATDSLQIQNFGPNFEIGIHGPSFRSEFLKKGTAIYGPPSWSEFSKRDTGIHEPLNRFVFLNIDTGIHEMPSCCEF